MTISQLRTQLTKYPPLMYQHELNSEFRTVRLLGPDTPPSHGHELYIGTAEDFFRWGIPEGVLDILCLGTVEDVHKIKGFESCNILIVSPELSVTTVLNRVLALMDTSEKFAKCSDLLLRSSMLLRGDSFDLNQVMDTVYELLDNPISICSPDGTILCYKHLEDITQRRTELFNVPEYIPSGEDAFQKISALVDFNADPVVLDVFEGYPTKNVVGKITKNETTVAYFLLVEVNRKIDDTDLAIFKMVCEWLSAEFRKNSIIFTPKRVMVSHFLSDLLTGTVSRTEEIVARAARLSIAEKPRHCIFVVDIQEVDFRHTSPHALRNTIGSLLPDPLSAIHNGNLVFYLNWEDELSVEAETQRQLWELEKQHNLRIGVSFVYTKLQDTKIAYEQALAAIRLGRQFDSKRSMFRYRDYTLYHLLEQHQIQSSSDLLSFCDPDLMALLEYDHQANNDYVYTTYVLLQCGGKQTEAANALHIHRSTMLYRMERIIELTGWDFRDMATLARLHISYAILVLNGILDAETYRM